MGEIAVVLFVLFVPYAFGYFLGFNAGVERMREQHDYSAQVDAFFKSLTGGHDA
jgi:hypothetical protein